MNWYRDDESLLRHCAVTTTTDLIEFATSYQSVQRAAYLSSEPSAIVERLSATRTTFRLSLPWSGGSSE